MTPEERTRSSPVSHVVPTEQIGEWTVGPCYGMSGCAWMQKGDDATTWTHFGSLQEARRMAAEATA